MIYKVQQRKDGRWVSVKGVTVGGDKAAFAIAQQQQELDPSWGSSGWRWVEDKRAMALIAEPDAR